MVSLKNLIPIPLLFFSLASVGCSDLSSSSEANDCIRKIDFLNRQFLYYEDGSGEIFSLEDGSKTLSLDNVAFKNPDAKKLSSAMSFEEIIERIGFPRFLGITGTNTLDFGLPDEDVYRVTFSGKGLFERLERIDYVSQSAWLDPNKENLPSREDAYKIKKGMSLDETVSLIGKPQGEWGYGAFIFDFSVDDGSTLSTWWSNEEYAGRNGPYHIYRMSLGQDVIFGDF